jgi:hypothetical protein
MRNAPPMVISPAILRPSRGRKPVRQLGGLGHALRAVKQADEADDQPDRASVERGAAFRVKARADHRELVQGVDQAVPDRRLADEPEQGHHDEQQREDRGEAVPGQRDDHQVGVVVTELLLHRIGHADPADPALEAVDRTHHFPQRIHWTHRRLPLPFSQSLLAATPGPGKYEGSNAFPTLLSL